MNPCSLMRRDIVALTAYPPPARIEDLEADLGRPIVRLDKNENPYGASPRVAEALAGVDAAHYPDPDSSELRAQLAEFLKISPEWIVCGAGGDEMIELTMRLFLEPGDQVIDSTPTFGMYRLAAAYSRGEVVRVARGEGFALDLPGIESAITARTKLIVLCNPNNPSGNPTPREEIIRVLEMGPMVLLDEAYVEFYGRTDIDLLQHYRNLVILRTMSKWAGLAGLRLGYGLMHPDVRTEMNKLKSPFNVGVAAQAAGMASLQDHAYLMENVRRIIAERESLYGRLQALPYGLAWPSEANFLYWSTGGVSAAELRTALLERGVLVRAFFDPTDALRFSVGTPAESDALMDALEDAYGALAG